MSGVYDTFDYRPEAMLPKANAPQADSRDAPPLLDTLTAGFRAARDENAYVQEDRLKDAYEPVFRAVSEATGKSRWDYKRPFEAMNPFDHDFIDYDTLWRDIAAARARDPKAFADMPKDRASFERQVLTRHGARGADADTLARGSGVAGFVGSAAAEFTDPVNLGVTIGTGGLGGVAGGGLRALGAGMAREAAINVATEAVETPGRIDAKAALGEEMTGEDVVRNLLAAAAFGAVVPAVAHGVKIGAEKVIPLARALDKARPAELRSPDEQAALHVLTRAGEVDQSNPFPQTLDGLDAHAAKIERVIADFHEPPASAGAGVAAGITPREPGRGSAARFDAERSLRFIVADLEGGAQVTRDSGGVTKFGISANAHPGLDVANLTEAQALAIYRREYVGALPLAGKSDDVATIALDAAVNHGPAFAKKLLAVAGDDPARMLALRRAEYARLIREDPGKYGDYAKGWENRLQRLEQRFGMRPGEAASAGDLAGLDDVPTVRPAALDAERPRVDYGGREVPLQSFAPAEIGVDAGLMQFKSGGDAHGVTDRFRGVQQWDPIAAGTVTVWEGRDGRRLIADGHQRLGLAHRLAADNPGLKLNAFVLREADGFSAADARILTALKNIGEGTGSAVDAAKVLREVAPGEAEAVLRRLPPRSALVRDGKDLSRLSDEAFGAVVNEVIPDAYGAAIARYAPDAETHMALVDLLYRADPPNRRQAEAIVRQAVDAGFSKEVQDELFGARELTSATIIQKARVIDKTLSELRKLKGAFSVAARNADALDAAGNKIDVGASEAAADGNAHALALVESLALRKGNAVNALVTEATQRLIAGEPLAAVVRDVVAGLRELDLEAALRDAGDAGDGPGGGGRAGVADREDPQDAPSLDEIEAAQPLDGSALEPSLFGDAAPARALDETADVQAAADSVWHDLRAAAPLRGENVTGKEQDGTMGAPLFDAANEPSFDLGDGRGERKLSEISDELDQFDLGIANIKACL